MLHCWKRAGALAFVVLLSAGCTEIDRITASSPSELSEGTAPNASLSKEGKYDRWGPNDDPSFFAAELEYHLDALPLEGEAATIPWAGDYWPTWRDSINHRWAGEDSDSPATKYGQAFGVEDIEDFVSYYSGIKGYPNNTACTTDDECDDTMGEACAIRSGEEAGVCIPAWWGICHAWAPASILEPEPKFPVTLDGVTFEVNDIKALLSLVYNKPTSLFVSLRCDENDSLEEIEYDMYASPTGDDVECKDTNPGTFHVIATNYLGLLHQSFVEDRTFDAEVWNQPVRGYRVTKLEEIPVQAANVLVGMTPDGADLGEQVQTFSGSVAPDEWHHAGSFSVTPGTPVTVEMTGSGDADLHVKFGSQPTSSSFDCRPYVNNSMELCVLNVPEGVTSMHVSVHGWTSPGSDADFTVEITSQSGSNTGISDSLSATLASTTWYMSEPYAVVPGQTVKLLMSGTGDADLYARFGENPTYEDFHCRSWNASTSDEVCEFTVPSGASALHVGVNAWHEWAGNSSFELNVLISGDPYAGIPKTYSFNNATAKTFHHVRMEFDFIFESPSSLNGPLADQIDQFTGTDVYEYVLEVDVDGRITGGEWIGESKTNHPDFLWLPTGRQEEVPIAYGAITYEQVKTLVDASQVAPVEETPEPIEEAPEVPAPAENVVLEEAGTLAKHEWAHFGPFTAGSGAFTAQMTGTGDADLHVRKGAAPTVALWDCRPYTGGSSETCSLEGPGIFYVGVRGYTATEFALTISYNAAVESLSDPITPAPTNPVTEEPEPDLEPEPAPEPVNSGNHLNVSDSVAQGEMKHYEVPMVAGQPILVMTTAPNDVDLYLKMAIAPTTNNYDQRGFTTSGNESLLFTPPAHGTLHIGVHGWEASNFTLTTSDG